jgi:hypothetical protein
MNSEPERGGGHLSTSKFARTLHSEYTVLCPRFACSSTEEIYLTEYIHDEPYATLTLDFAGAHSNIESRIVQLQIIGVLRLLCVHK